MRPVGASSVFALCPICQRIQMTKIIAKFQWILNHINIYLCQQGQTRRSPLQPNMFKNTSFWTAFVYNIDYNSFINLKKDYKTMKKLILLFSHNLTDVQKEDAKGSFGVESFVVLPADLQTIWSNVLADLEDLNEYLQPVRDFLVEELAPDDVVLVQGDFGATCAMASFVKSITGIAVYATTKRNVEERELDGKIVKTSVFEHVRFRRF